MAIKVGVIGYGYWGPNLARNFSQIDSTELYYVSDLDSSKTDQVKKIYPNVKTSADYKDILNDPDVDAIVIAVPVAKHFEIAKEGLLHGKNVLIEKPMTASVKEAEELVELAKSKNKVLMVDHTFEYELAIDRVKEIIESGELGDIFYFRADWLNLGLLQPDVNVIWDLATHIVSIISYVSKMEPVSLSANASAFIRGEIPEVANIHLKYPKGITAYIMVSWLEPRKTRSITIAGSKKMLVYDLTNEEEKIKIYDKGVDLAGNIDNVRELKVNYRYGDIYSPNVKKVEPLSSMCSHFADCIADKKEPRSSGLSGLNVVRILEASQKSLDNGGKEVILKDD
ncbi:oxidoreductase [Candidatus Woesearchaeota archaeon]|nr:oxidoreductase [Candidatus Woesearchaeota archaeon]